MKTLVKVILYQPLYNLFILLVAIAPGHSAGIAIILLTVIVRLILTPFKYKALESQMKQRDLQGEVKALQDKHKGDRQAQSAAMMQLYKERGVNPASGCLPQLVQFPILIALYSVFRLGFGDSQHHLLYPFIHAPEQIGAAFLWVKDLTKPDPTYILPVLAGIGQFFFSKALMQTMPTSGDPKDMTSMMSKQMTYMFPVITIIAGARFPAALSLYWVVGILIEWYQQVQGMKRFGKAPKTIPKVSVSVRKRKES